MVVKIRVFQFLILMAFVQQLIRANFLQSAYNGIRYEHVKPDNYYHQRELGVQSNEEYCIKECRNIIIQRPQQWDPQNHKTLDIYACAYNQTGGQCYFGGWNYPDMVNDTNLQQSENFITYVNVIPLQLPTAMDFESGWYINSKCKSGAAQSQDIQLIDSNNLQNCLSFFKSTYSCPGDSCANCVQIEMTLNANGMYTCAVYDQCSEDLTQGPDSQNWFCYYHDNSVVTDTIQGPGQKQIQEYDGVVQYNRNCLQPFRNQLATAVEINWSNVQLLDDCLQLCLNARIDQRFMNTYFYCCVYDDPGNVCYMIGDDQPVYKLDLFVNDLGRHSYLNVIPRNLRYSDYGGSMISAQCQGNIIQFKSDSFSECMVNFKVWRESQDQNINYCAHYVVSNTTHPCRFMDNCNEDPIIYSASHEYCYQPLSTVTVSPECILTPSKHESTNDFHATIDQSTCFSIDKFAASSGCGSDNLTYSLTDLEGQIISDLLWYEDGSQDGKIHVCPKNLRQAQSLQFRIEFGKRITCHCLGIVDGFNNQDGIGSYCSDHWSDNPLPWCYVNIECSGSEPTSVSGFQNTIGWVNCSNDGSYYMFTQSVTQDYEMIMSSNIHIGPHSSKGLRLENQCCSGFSAVKKPLVGIDQMGEIECLHKCLNAEIDQTNHQSLYICNFYKSYTDQKNYCWLDGQLAPTIDCQDCHIDDADNVLYLGIIPQNLSMNLKGGWRINAYCSGTYETLLTQVSSLEECRLQLKAFILGQSLNESSSCAQYQSDVEYCTLFSNCDPQVGSLNGFQCYNPGFRENELSAPQNLPSRNFLVQQDQIAYQFEDFPCVFCFNHIIYEVTLVDSNTSQSLIALQQNFNSSSQTIYLNATVATSFNFKIYAQLQDFPEINASSNEVTITIVQPVKPAMRNFAPQFIEDLPDEYIFDDLFTDNSGVNFSLPEVWDDSSPEDVSILVEGLDESISLFDSDLKQFQFFNLTEPKNLTVKITLTDLEGMAKSQTVKFVFDIQEIIQPQIQKKEVKSTFVGVVIDEVDQEASRKEQDKAGEEDQIAEFTCFIKSISSQAEVLVQFSEEVEQFNKTFINESSLRIEVIPSAHMTPQELNQLTLSWNVLQFYSNKLYLQLNFDNPLLVSTKLEQDILQIWFFNNSSLFRADKTKKPLDLNFKIRKEIKPQIVDSQAAKNFAQATDEAAGYMNKSFWLIFCFQLVASSQLVALSYIQLINAMQMIIYLPITQIRFPANCMQLLTSTQPVAQFDPLDGFENSKYSLEEMNIWDKQDTSFEEMNFSSQMQDLEFESLNSMLNLGSLSFFLIIYICKNIFFAILYLTIVRKYGWFREIVTQQLRSAIFNEIILLTIESSLDIFVAGYLQSLKRDISWTYFGEAMSSILGCICYILIGSLSIFYLYIVMQPREVRDSERFKSIFGEFYNSVKTHNIYQVSYNFLFVMRRIIFCIALFAIKSPGCQFVFIYFNNLFFSMYFFYHKPKSIPHLQYLEMFNEVMINLITLHLVPFSEMGPNDPELQFQIGYSMCAFICVLQLVNVLFCIYFLVLGSRLVCIRHYRRYPKYRYEFFNGLLQFSLKMISKDKEKQTIEAPVNQQQNSSSCSSSTSESATNESQQENLNAPRLAQSQKQTIEEEKEPDRDDPEVVKNHMSMLADAHLEIQRLKDELQSADKQIDKSISFKTVSPKKEQTGNIGQPKKQTALVDLKNKKEIRSYLDDGLEYDEATYQRVREELRTKKANEAQKFFETPKSNNQPTKQKFQKELENKREVKSYLDDGLEYDQATYLKVREELRAQRAAEAQKLIETSKQNEFIPVKEKQNTFPYYSNKSPKKPENKAYQAPSQKQQMRDLRDQTQFVSFGKETFLEKKENYLRSKHFPITQQCFIHYPSGVQWKPGDGQTVLEFNQDLPDLKILKIMPAKAKHLAQNLKRDKSHKEFKIQLQIFQQLLYELSYRGERPIEIGQFMDYSKEDIMRAVYHFELTPERTRNFKNQPEYDKEVLFFKFRCFLFHLNKRT